MLRQLGKYQLVEVLHQGKLSVVYKAYQPSLERYVVVKALPSHQSPHFAARFKRAARTSAALQHQHILTTYDYGEEGDTLYLVLQYIESGLTLRSLLERPIDTVQSVKIMGDLLSAMEYAHQRGIIHRNIKPANIMMRSPTWPLLADFGIAKILSETQPSSSPNQIVGTPAYMAPEQATNASLDTRTDLYAAGVILYEMLAGRVPFEAETPVDMLTKHVYAAPLPPSRLNPNLPSAVDDVVLRALAKSPDERYQSAIEMADDLRRATSGAVPRNQVSQTTSLYQSAVQAFEEGRWTLAVELLNQVISLDPDREEAADMLEVARVEQLRARDEAKRLAAIIAAQDQTGKRLLPSQLNQRVDIVPPTATGDRITPLPATTLSPQISAPPGEALRERQVGQALSASLCPQCKREIQPDWLACPYCRAPLAAAPVALTTAQPSMLAPSETGRVLTPATVAAESINSPPHRWPLWAVLLVAVALVVVVGGFSLAFRSRAATTEPTVASLGAEHVPTAAPPTVAQGVVLAAALTSAPAPTNAPVLTSASSPTSAPSPTAAPDAIVNLDSLKLRDGPGTIYTFQHVYAQGTGLKIIGKESSGVWLQVQTFDGQIGWMRAQDLALNITLDSIPLIAIVPSPPPTPTLKPTARPAAQPRPAYTSTPMPAEPPTAAPAPVEPPTAMPASVATATPANQGEHHPPAPPKQPGSGPPKPPKQQPPSK